MDSPGLAGLGEIESIVAVGAALEETNLNWTASAQVLKVSPAAAVIVTEPLPSKEKVPRLFHRPAFSSWLTVVFAVPPAWFMTTGTFVAREEYPDHHMRTS